MEFSEGQKRMPSVFRGVFPGIQCDNWEIREPTIPQDLLIPVSETLFTVGNGLIGIRGYFEETDAASSIQYYRNQEQNKINREHSGVVTPLSAHASQMNSSPSTPTNVVEPPRAPVHSIRASYCSGFFEQRLLNRTRAYSVGMCLKESHLVPIPDAFCIDVFIAGEHVSPMTGRVLSHSRRLDLRTGELHRRMVWESLKQHREVTIESTRFASGVRKNIAATRFSVTAKNVSNTDIRIVSRVELPEEVVERRYYELEDLLTRSSIQEASSVVQVRTRNSCRRLVAAAVETCRIGALDDSFSKQFPRDSVPSVGSSSTSPSEMALASPAMEMTTSPYSPGSGNAPGAVSTTYLTPKSSETDIGTDTTFTSCISERMKIELVKFVGFFGDEDAPQEELCDVAIIRTNEAARCGFDGLLQEHRNAMNRYWDTADVRIKASTPSMQGAFHYNLLQLNMSSNTSQIHCIPTRGLTGASMAGVQQWDVDALLIPFFSHVCPERARAMLLFRINTLNQARSIASDFDLPRGALYPHRTINGSENPTPYCGAFLFVNAVIVHTMRTYVVATGDQSILEAGGADVVLLTALVWIQWGSWEKGRFHLRFVSGPDTYSGITNDNFFTNVMAQQHLTWACQVAVSIREKNPSLWMGLTERCQITDKDIEDMARAAENMTILFDAENRIFPIGESFTRKKKWCFGDLKDDSHGNLADQFHPSVLFRHQVCRIPDVMLALMLLPDCFSEDEMKANFNYYEPITTQDSALRLTIYSVVGAHLNLADKASFYFRKTLFVDVENVIGDTGGGLHCTTSAGSWWALVLGFCGMRVVQGVLHFSPRLPLDCEEYQCKVRHRGCVVRVTVTERLVTYLLVEATPQISDLLVIHAGLSRIRLLPNVPETVRMFREARVFDFDCVIFDLDAVLEDVESIHYAAWRTVLEEYFHETGLGDFTLTRELYLAYLRHNRIFSGLQDIMKKNGCTPLPRGEPGDSAHMQTMNGLSNRKIEAFRTEVRNKGIRFREGAIKLLTDLRECDIAVGCVSGSRNGNWIRNEASQLRTLIDAFIDRNEGDAQNLRWRPEMDFYEGCAKEMDSAPSRAVVVMDGIDGFSKSCLERFCMIVDVSEEPENVNLSVPRLMSHDFKDITVELLDEYTSHDSPQHHVDVTFRRRHTTPTMNSDVASPNVANPMTSESPNASLTTPS